MACIKRGLSQQSAYQSTGSFYFELSLSDQIYLKSLLIRYDLFKVSEKKIYGTILFFTMFSRHVFNKHCIETRVNNGRQSVRNTTYLLMSVQIVHLVNVKRFVVRCGNARHDGLKYSHHYVHNNRIHAFFLKITSLNLTKFYLLSLNFTLFPRFH